MACSSPASPASPATCGLSLCSAYASSSHENATPKLYRFSLFPLTLCKCSHQENKHAKSIHEAKIDSLVVIGTFNSNKPSKIGRYADFKSVDSGKFSDKVFLTNSCQFSCSLILANKDGGTLTFKDAVQASLRVVVNCVGLAFSGFHINDSYNNNFIITM